MREWSKENIVIISESSSPEDFKRIWCIKSHSTNQYTHKQYKDCLYIHENIYNKISKKTLNNLNTRY